MISRYFAIMLLSIALSAAGTTEPPKEPNRLKNPEFTKGLSGWKTMGAVTLEAGRGVRLGPGEAILQQTYLITGERVVLVDANVTVDHPLSPVKVKAECLDAHGQVLMTLTAGLDPKKPDALSAEPGVYFKTHSLTKSVRVRVELPAGANGSVRVSRTQLLDYDRNKKRRATICNLDAYVTPFWTGNKVVDEPVLFVGGLSAKLLFEPSKLFYVRDNTLKTCFQEGKDFAIEGRTIRLLPGSKIPSVPSNFFEAGDLKWYSITGRHVVVTYEHVDKWNGPIPPDPAGNLPAIHKKLLHRDPITLAVTGDSITLGHNASGFVDMAPYMPTWPQLLAHKLQKQFGSVVTLRNAALGGMTSDWGLATIKDTVASHKPDLVVIAYGMNDFWWMPAETYRENVKGMIAEVRKVTPSAEFVLVAPMWFDPAYALDPQYSSRLASYGPALESLRGGGVEVLDLLSISAALHAAKKPKDFLTDPLHPNDFMARVYAAGVATLICGSAQK